MTNPSLEVFFLHQFFFFFAIICWISRIFCPTEFPLVCICKWHILVSFKVFLCLLYLLAIRFRSFIRFRFNFFSNTTLFYFIDSIVHFHEGHIMSNYLSSLWKTWWPMSISINSLEVKKWWFCIFVSSSYTANITCFLEIVITMFGMKRASVLRTFTHSLFLFRNILYHLDEKTSQFSIVLEARERCKLLASNETLQAALSEVLNSINSAQVYFKAGLDVFESVLVGKNWENSQHFKKFVYNSSSKSSNLTGFSDIEVFPPSDFLYKSKAIMTLCF